MELNFRPLSLGELLDQSISLYRRNFALFVGIVAVVRVPIAVLTILTQWLLSPGLGTLAGFGPDFNASVLIVYYLSLLVTFLLSTIGGMIEFAAMSAAVSDRYHERPITVGGAYGRSLRRWDSLLLLLIILGVANAAVVSLIFVPYLGLVLSTGFGGAPSYSPLAGVFACLSCILWIPGVLLLIYLNTRWALAIPALVVEKMRAAQSLGRSWRLVKGQFWRVLAAAVLLYLFVTLIVAGPTALASFAITAAISNFLISQVLSQVLSSLIGVVITPIEYIMLTLLYYDLRIRKEGYDLEQRVESIGELPPMFSQEQGA